MGPADRQQERRPRQRPRHPLRHDAEYACDAETLHQIWNSELKPKRDRLGTLVKFVPHLVAGGKIYAPSYDNIVNVYGVQP